MGRRSVGVDKNTVAAVAGANSYCQDRAGIDPEAPHSVIARAAVVVAEANSLFPDRAGLDRDSTSPWVLGGTKAPARNG